VTCDELRDDYFLFAIGVLEEPGKSELRAHLARGCETCTAGMREARRLAYGLGASVEGPDPPRSLRNRILGAHGAVPAPKWHWATAWVTAGAAALLSFGVVLYQSRSRDAEIGSLRRQLQQTGAEAGALRAAVALLQSPETREVNFGQGAPEPPRGRVFYRASTVLLIAYNLPPPPPGKAYEMWIIPQGGRPIPAGMFAPNTEGGATHLFGAAAPLSRADTIAVTIEAAAGVSAPTSQPVIAVQL
jgi:hypothetical protein